MEHALLAIETSGKSGSVAILRHNQGQVMCNSMSLSPESGSAKTLAPAIRDLLASNQIEMRRLSAIALLTGPGSFTGLRVGVSTAKAMAYALKIPTVAVDTLDVIARQCPVLSNSVYAVLDAYRGQVFCAEYVTRGSDSSTVAEKVTSTEILDLLVLLERASIGSDKIPTVDFCGPGCDRIRRFLAAPENFEVLSSMESIGRIRWIDGPETIPNAESVAVLGLAKFIAGEILDPFVIKPQYLRASAAEEVAAKSI